MLNPKTETENLPLSPGVYLFKDNSHILYVGKAKNLRKRVASYFRKSPIDNKVHNLTSRASRISYIEVDTEFEALLLEAELIKKHKPKYNSILKDDKNYIYIKITKEEFPKVTYSRKLDETGDDFFGPYPASATVRQIISILRHIFPFCTQKRLGNKPCFFSHLGLCNPCPGRIVKLAKEDYLKQKRKYKKNISLLKLTLHGKLKTVKNMLIREMNHAAQEEKYEEAAILRNTIHKLEYLSTKYHTPASYIDNPTNINQIRDKEQKSLLDILSTYYTEVSLPKKIECYDISNIAGKFAVGSQVTFIEGQPAKNLYKRFKIRTKSTPDDFAMLKEMFERRFSHIDWPLPNLIVVDGGIPQVSTIKKVLTEKKVNVPLIGLAKRNEEIIVPISGKFVTIKLPIGAPALSLIQRVRDEAHRFAHKYHELLRLKYLLNYSIILLASALIYT